MARTTNAKAVTRRDQICEMYREGYTLQQIADRFNISRERVRQIAKRANVHRDRTLATKKRHEQQMQSLNLDALREMYINGAKPQHMAQKFKVTQQVIKQALAETCNPNDRLARRLATPRGRHQKYTNERILQVLQTAAKINGNDSLSYVAYNRLAENTNWPSAQVIMLRFGTWNKATEAAGLQTNSKRNGFGEAKFSDEDCKKAMHRIAKRLGHPPSCAEYTDNRKPKEPTMHTIRRRFQGRWSNVLNYYFD